jgi:hypothetical protein
MQLLHFYKKPDFIGGPIFGGLTLKGSILTDLPIKIDKIAGIINGESNMEKLIIVVPNPRFPLAR